MDNIANTYRDLKDDSLSKKIDEIHGDKSRYDVIHHEVDGNNHELVKIAKKPSGAVDFHTYSKRKLPRYSAWHDPEISNLETQNQGEPFERISPKIKPESGYSENITPSGDKNTIYRGISHEEFDEIQKTGKIKSKGDYNMEGQEGLTYFSTDPTSAQFYAHNFAPEKHKASTGKHAYVIGVKNPGTGVKIQGTGEHEVGIPHEMSKDDITEIHEGKPYAGLAGSASFHEKYGGSFGNGSSSSPITLIAWKRLK